MDVPMQDLMMAAAEMHRMSLLDRPFRDGKSFVIYA